MHVDDFEYNLNKAVMTTLEDFPFIFGHEVMYIKGNANFNIWR